MTRADWAKVLTVAVLIVFAIANLVIFILGGGALSMIAFLACGFALIVLVARA